MLLGFFITLGALLTLYTYYKAIYTSPGHLRRTGSEHLFGCKLNIKQQPVHATEEELTEAVKEPRLRATAAKESQRYWDEKENPDTH